MRSILLLPLVGALAVPAAADWTPTMSGHVVGFGFNYPLKDRHHTSSWRRRDRAGCASRRWAPAHYATVSRDVWVPASCEQVWRPAQWGWTYRSGRRVRSLVRPAGYVTVHSPGHYECVQTRVWVPGRYERS
jgi:hypothetical protein